MAVTGCMFVYMYKFIINSILKWSRKGADEDVKGLRHQSNLRFGYSGRLGNLEFFFRFERVLG